MASYVCSRCGAPGETGRGGRTRCLDPYRVGTHKITDPPAPKISDNVILNGHAPTPAPRLTIVRPKLAELVAATVPPANSVDVDDSPNGAAYDDGYVAPDHSSTVDDIDVGPLAFTALTESDAQAAFDAEQDGEIVTAIVGKDRRAALEAIRLTLARELRDAVGKDVATIARELRATLTALDSIPDPKGATRVDNIAESARAKLAR